MLADGGHYRFELRGIDPCEKKIRHFRYSPSQHRNSCDFFDRHFGESRDVAWGTGRILDSGIRRNEDARRIRIQYDKDQTISITECMR